MFLWSQVPVEGTEAHLSIEQVYICFVDRWASAPSTDGLLLLRQTGFCSIDRKNG